VRGETLCCHPMYLNQNPEPVFERLRTMHRSAIGSEDMLFGSAAGIDEGHGRTISTIAACGETWDDDGPAGVTGVRPREPRTTTNAEGLLPRSSPHHT